MQAVEKGHHVLLGALPIEAPIALKHPLRRTHLYVSGTAGSLFEQIVRIATSRRLLSSDCFVVQI